MAIVLLILKIIGVVLLVLLALLLLLMLLPVGIRWSWQEQALSVWLKAGPLSVAVWPQRRTTKPAGEKPPEKAASKPAAPPGESARTGSAVKTLPSGGGKPAASGTPPAAKKPEPAPAQKAGTAPAQAAAAEPPASSVLPKFITERVQAAIAFARRDPMAFAGTALGHAGWFTKRLLRGIRITHLRVWWSITGEEASQTAMLFAGAMTASNNLLTYLRQFMTVEADSLWLEPDFTGQQRARRAVSGQVLTRPGILLLLAARLGWRLWHEPNFQPSDR